jgi:hypothetical protein
MKQSDPIPLPKSHVHHSASEREIDSLAYLAELRDTRMFELIIDGMQSQCLRNGGQFHPLSQKSLVGIMHTKNAEDDALFAQRRQGGRQVFANASNIVPSTEEYHNESGVHCSRSRRRQSDSSMSLDSSFICIASSTTASTVQYVIDQDDDCIFRFEL